MTRIGFVLSLFFSLPGALPSPVAAQAYPYDTSSGAAQAMPPEPAI